LKRCRTPGQPNGVRFQQMQLPDMNHIALSADGSILIAAIDNPPHNHLTVDFMRELNTCRKFFEDPGTRAVVLTGRGSVFSKGFDVRELQAQAAQLDSEALQTANDLLTFLSELPKPVVAAIDGPCFGGGMELALACHVRVCSDKARLGLPELSAGIIPGLGGVPRLCRVVGEAKALEMMLLGDMISAAQAVDIGLVSRVFPREGFQRKALMFVKTIIAAPADAVAGLLDAVTCARRDGDAAAILQSAEAFRRLIGAVASER